MKKNTLPPTLLFTLVALLSFSVWALGSRLYSSEIGMYTICALVFFGLGGLTLIPGSGIAGRKAVAGFCIRFALGFTGYAAIWTTAWFTFRNTFGEVIGSFLGLVILVAALRRGVSSTHDFLTAVAVVFLWHTLGYYTGGLAYQTLQNGGVFAVELPFDRATVVTLARFSWGLFYGLGLGYGLVRITRGHQRN